MVMMMMMMMMMMTMMTRTIDRHDDARPQRNTYGTAAAARTIITAPEQRRPEVKVGILKPTSGHQEVSSPDDRGVQRSVQELWIPPSVRPRKIKSRKRKPTSGHQQRPEKVVARQKHRRRRQEKVVVRQKHRRRIEAKTMTSNTSKACKNHWFSIGFTFFFEARGAKIVLTG